MKKVYNIVWDIDEGDGIEFFYGLPEETELPDDIEDDHIADWLSDEYGFCVDSYTI